MHYHNQMEISFFKMHGSKNDFVVFDDLDNMISLSSDQVAFICHRRAGVGADGIIIIRASNVADFFMDYINADGSLAEMCGNGIRCVAKYVYDTGMTSKGSLPIETRAGVKIVELDIGQDNLARSVRVDMGPPIFEPEKIPVNLASAGSPIIDHELESNGKTFPVSLVSMGNPHCVIEAQEHQLDWHLKYGPDLEKHSLFPQKTNVEFVRFLDQKNTLMNVWERGSGETLACGTGACAVAVVGILKGKLDNKSIVKLKGGDLEIEWNGMGNSVFMTGPAVTVFKGALTI